MALWAGTRSPRTAPTRSTSWSSCAASGSTRRASEARRAIGRVREHVTWGDGAWWNPPWADHRFFEGEVEPCINGNVVATGSYFGVDMTPLVERLLGEQLPDGGWNCEVESGATVSSFGTTINVLEGLLEYERAIGGSAKVGEARRRGEEYLLERRLFRRKSTGEVIDPELAPVLVPDLVALRRPARARLPARRRAHAATSASPRRSRSSRATGIADGRWPLQNVYDGEVHFEMEDGEGEPSRWNTLRALRVLDWFGGRPRGPPASPSKPRDGRLGARSRTSGPGFSSGHRQRESPEIVGPTLLMVGAFLGVRQAAMGHAHQRPAAPGRSGRSRSGSIPAARFRGRPSRSCRRGDGPG